MPHIWKIEFSPSRMEAIGKHCLCRTRTFLRNSDFDILKTLHIKTMGSRKRQRDVTMCSPSRYVASCHERSANKSQPSGDHLRRQALAGKQSKRWPIGSSFWSSDWVSGVLSQWCGGLVAAQFNLSGVQLKSLGNWIWTNRGLVLVKVEVALLVMQEPRWTTSTGILGELSEISNSLSELMVRSAS